jgi:hypothetical protein
MNVGLSRRVLEFPGWSLTRVLDRFFADGEQLRRRRQDGWLDFSPGTGGTFRTRWTHFSGRHHGGRAGTAEEASAQRSPINAENCL